MEPPCASSTCTHEGLSGMTSSDKVIGLRNGLATTLSLTGYAVEIHRNNGATATISLSGNVPADGCVIIYRASGSSTYISTLNGFDLSRVRLVSSDEIRFMTGDDQLALTMNGVQVDVVGLSSGVLWGKNLVSYRSSYTGAATPATPRNGGGLDWTLVTSHSGTSDDWTAVGGWSGLEGWLCPTV